MANRKTSSQTLAARQIDLILLAVTLLLLAIGLVMVFSSSAFFAERRIGDEFFFFYRQLAFVVGGFVVLFITSHINYKNYEKLIYPMLAVLLIMLIAVLIPGVGRLIGGARRWIPIGSFHLQPSELAKLILIMYVAYSVSKQKERNKTFVSGFLNHLLIPIGMLALILIEPDFGTTALMLLAIIAMLFVSGSPMRYLLVAGAVLLPLISSMMLIFPHALGRLTAFMNQILTILGEKEDYTLLCYQVRESLISFGSGRFFGEGLGKGTMKMFFLPQAHSDFILATLGQELGFFGVALLLFLFAVLAIRGYQISLRVPDTFGCYLAFGLTTLLSLQFLFNSGVVLGVLPPKGLALPFISYGGSALLSTLAAVGILLNISRYTVNYSNFRGGRR